jgi:ABC-type multidrug transport system ATPase subunit
MTPSSLEAPLPAAPPSTQEVAAAAVAPRPIANDACPLAIRGVTKRWRKDQPPVLDGLNLALEPGTIVWVGGRNGAGKTTMLRIAAGLIEPEAGRAEVWGVSARENRVRYQTLVSFLPAGDRGLYARLTVRRQLEFWARISMMAPGGVRHSVEQAMDAFNLRELADQRVDRMSMGQRQRLRIAMTFLTEPEIVLVDEPLTSLDSEGVAILDLAIEALIARDGALLWCSPEVERFGRPFDVRWILEDGRLAKA